LWGTAVHRILWDSWKRHDWQCSKSLLLLNRPESRVGNCWFERVRSVGGPDMRLHVWHFSFYYPWHCELYHKICSRFNRQSKMITYC
jgi:hypothetical protein